MIANRSYDCVVIGGGPGGSTAAAIVAEQGHSVLVIERDKVPRDHVGESLMPEAYWIFDRLGIVHEMDRVGFTRKHGVQFVNSKGKESKPFIFAEHDDRPSKESWHVKRSLFDKLLYETAYNRGATCVDETRVLDITVGEKGSNRVTIQTPDGKEQEIVGKVIIDASGQSAMLANRMGLKEVYPDLKKAAIWGYFEGAQRAGAGKPELTCILHTKSKDAWFWYIPLMDGTVSIGLVGDNDYLLKRGCSPQETYDTEIKNCEGIQRRLQDATQVGRPQIAKEFSYRVSKAGRRRMGVSRRRRWFHRSNLFVRRLLSAAFGHVGRRSSCRRPEQRRRVGQTVGRWTKDFDKGVEWIRKLVRAYYTKEFSVGAFMKEYPHHAGNLTDLLTGKVFEGTPGKIFEDMDPFIEKVKSGEMQPSA